MRSVDDGVYVPSLSITMSIVLSLVSVGAFVYFIHFVSHSISVGNIMSLIMGETSETLETMFPEEVGVTWEAAFRLHLVPIVSEAEREMSEAADREAINRELRWPARTLGQDVEPLLLEVHSP